MINVIDDEEFKGILEAAKLFLYAQRTVSVSLLQRRFKINYTYAIRLVKRMEVDGVVTQPDLDGVRYLAAQECKDK